MLLHSIHSEKLATLATQVRLAGEATTELLSEIVAKTAQRMYPPGAAQLDQLIEAGALTEAAFALVPVGNLIRLASEAESRNVSIL
jgi:hypothetical protein